MIQPLSAIVVAGGRSSRLGFDKRGLRFFGSQTLLEHTVERLQELTKDVVVVVSDDASKYGWLGTPIVRDLMPGTGPASAVAAGLNVVTNDYAVVVATDLPFLSTAALRVLADYPRDYDLLVPRHANGRLEMLHGIYHRPCEAAIRRRIDHGQFKLALLVDDVSVRYINADELRAENASLPPLFNLNTPDDLAAADLLVRSTRRRAQEIEIKGPGETPQNRVD